MTEEQLQHLVEQLSLENFARPFLHRAYFNSRLKTTGGRYILATHHIEINEKMYEHFGVGELRGIILHELCHYHLHIQGLGYKHRDKDFRELLAKVGAPRFCSTLEKVSKKNNKFHVYRCTQCGQQYTRKRRFDVKKYCCSKCNGKIMYIQLVQTNK